MLWASPTGKTMLVFLGVMTGAHAGKVTEYGEVGVLAVSSGKIRPITFPGAASILLPLHVAF